MSDQPLPIVKVIQVKNFLSCTDAKAIQLAEAFNKAFPLYGLNTPKRTWMAIAQMAHESWNFSKFEESLYYKTADRIKATWPGRFKTLSDALPYVKAPEKLAEKVYLGRMGNNKPGDGWHFRGGGPIQITGKENHTAYDKHKGFGDVYKTADLIKTDLIIGVDSACWFLTEYINIGFYADREDVVGSTKLINGGLVGIDERKELYMKAKTIFV
jgi:putative chitinase